MSGMLSNNELNNRKKISSMLKKNSTLR